MKHLLYILLLGMSLTASAQHTYYSLAPHSAPASSDVKAGGQGENGYFACAVLLDPAQDPVFARLAGKQILGVRCYLRVAYEQEFDERSFILLNEDAPAAKPDEATCSQYADFAEGWNEILFDKPYTIGEKPVYIGYGVFELFGSPYPAVSLGTASTPGGYFVNLKRAGWNEYNDRGTLLIEAILSDDAQPLLERTAFARVASSPLMVEPSKAFTGTVYVKNHSTEPITSLTVETLGQGDSEPHTLTFTPDEPIAAYDGVVLPASVFAGSEEGLEQTLTLVPSVINGEAAAECREGVSTHYVTQDAFTRIPLIEEFTSQLCTNCPRMKYYLHQAMAQYSGPLLLVTHHSGYADDIFTTDVDKELLFLFASGGYGYNPAMMIDRTILSGQALPVFGSPGTEVDPYIALFDEASLIPAKAEAIVDAQKDGQTLNVTVTGRVHRDILSGSLPVYLSTYLIEDGIPVVGVDPKKSQYFQYGMDTDGAPSDIYDWVHHDGIIRHNFCTKVTGDKITCNDDGTYSVTYDPITLEAGWKWENCQVVSFVHHFSSLKIANNIVLNAGSNVLTPPSTGIEPVSMPTATTSGQYYDLTGRRVAQPTRGGIYIIDGKKIIF